MLRSCLMCGRSSYSKNKDLYISFHRFPKNEVYQSQWLHFIEKCGLNHLEVKPKSIICSKHFTKDSFKYYLHSKLLNDAAVPSIVTDCVKSPKIEMPVTQILAPINQHLLTMIILK